jgi:hypothetical protein
MTIGSRALLAPLGALCVALGVSACGQTTSTGGYKGESKQVAQTISNLQSDATSANASKVCNRDLSASVVKRLEAGGETCKKALEDQLREVDTYSLTVESISVHGDAATAKVKSTWSGKEKVHQLSFVKEGGSWKVAALS